jgi:hypothetical protein
VFAQQEERVEDVLSGLLLPEARRDRSLARIVRDERLDVGQGAHPLGAEDGGPEQHETERDEPQEAKRAD